MNEKSFLKFVCDKSNQSARNFAHINKQKLLVCLYAQKQ